MNFVIKFLIINFVLIYYGLGKLTTIKFSYSIFHLYNKRYVFLDQINLSNIEI